MHVLVVKMEGREGEKGGGGRVRGIRKKEEVGVMKKKECHAHHLF